MALDYRKCAGEIAAHVGGPGNISEISLCADSLRLVLKDRGKAEKDELENVDGVKGIFESDGKLKLVLGSDSIREVYRELTSLTGLSAPAEEAGGGKPERRGVGAVILPILPAILILGIAAALVKILGRIPETGLAERDWYGILDQVANAALILIPVIILISLIRVLRRRSSGGIAPAAGGESSAEAEGTPDSGPAVKTGLPVVMSCAAGEIHAPTAGKIRKYTEIPDETFASGVLGEGVGIEPTEEDVYAPFDGTISTLAESKHAIGMTGNGDMELLIHVGVDTVTMNGDGFAPLVREGETVTRGQKLMHFDRKKIARAGHSDMVVVLLTNSEDMEGFRLHL